MYCSNCGKTMADGAAICLSCGFAKGTGNAFCENCGAPRNPNAVVCTSCGCAVASKTGSVGTKSKLVAGLLELSFVSDISRKRGGHYLLPGF